MKPASLFVIGLGPGNPAFMAPKALAAIQEAACLVGYTPYLNLLPPQCTTGKEIVTSGMRQERDRCSHAIAKALAGMPTAIICSGDPGIYAMASLVLEILTEQNLINALPWEVIPGIPALCALAAKTGAPLGHDFACISLSDLLTPIATIRQRLENAMAADFVCVLYNPRSKGRPAHLAEALTLARRFRQPSCPVILGRNVTRPDEYILLSTLEEFDPELADMSSLVIVGNSETFRSGNAIITPRGYANKE